MSDLVEENQRLREAFLKLRERAFKYAEKGYAMNAREIELFAYKTLNPTKVFKSLRKEKPGASTKT